MISKLPQKELILIFSETLRILNVPIKSYLEPSITIFAIYQYFQNQGKKLTEKKN